MPARHLDESANAYRGTYWVQPPMNTIPAFSPNVAEKGRNEGLHKADVLATKSLEGRSSVRFTGSATVNRPWTPTNPLETGAFARSATVQSWLADTGSRRSLPTNIVDPPTDINVNQIRSDKISYIEPHAWGTGRIYNPQSCNDNWIEERYDSAFAPDVLPKEQQMNKTEYTASLGTTALMATGGAPARTLSATRGSIALSSLGGTARIIKPGNSVGGRPKSENRGQEVLYYGKEGYGPYPRQDHTLPSKRGGFWVGTTPFKPYESSTMTQQTGTDKFEYQKRQIAHDPIAMVFSNTKQDPDLLNRTNDRFAQSQKLSTTWKTRYQSDFANFSGHKAAPQLGPTAAEASLLAERTAKSAPASAVAVGGAL